MTARQKARNRCQREIDSALREAQKEGLSEGERLGILMWELDWTVERERIEKEIGDCND